MDAAWMMGAKAERPVAMKLQVRRTRKLGDCRRGWMTTKAVRTESAPIYPAVRTFSETVRLQADAHHRPIQHLQMRLTVEANVDARDERPEDLKDDGDVVNSHPQVPVIPGVAEQRVVE
jgi:hypothetical protein